MTFKPTNAVLPLLFSFMALSCRHQPEELSAGQYFGVRDSVTQMADRIARDVSRRGPVAWLSYFENSPDFFMASEGVLALPDYDSAKNAIQQTLVKSMSNIRLQWSNIKVDPLTERLAGMGAGFHEDITYSSGKKVSQDGYFTAIAEKSYKGWLLRNAHWSVPVAAR